MAKKSKENTSALKANNYEKLRQELLEILAAPGGSPGVFSDLQKILIDGLTAARKKAVKRECQEVIYKKLMDMDTLIVESAIHNMRCAEKNMCGVHFPLVKFARDLIAEQKMEIDRLANKGAPIKEPFDLSFLVKIGSGKEKD